MSERTLDKSVEPEQARQMLGKREAVAIDLRDLGPEEILEAGRPPGSTAVLDGDVLEAAAKARGDDELPVLVFSEDGEGASDAVEELRKAGIEAAAVKGGWDNWTSEGQPVQPKPDKEFEGPDLSKLPGAGTQR